MSRAGVLSVLVSAGFLLAHPDLLAMYHYTPHLVALTHLFVLGFICSIVMGALYQLVPVTLKTQLFSERLVKWQFAAHVIGFTGMVWAFWNFNMALVGAFGPLLTLGVGLFVFNLACTLMKVKNWNAIKSGISSALFWLSSAIVAGLLLTASKCRGFIAFQPLAAIHAHAHLGVVGVFWLMIVTVSYKLVPMFPLSELQNERRAWWSVALLNVGLLGTFVAVLLQSPLKPVFAWMIIAGFALYGLEINAILRARNRRTLDWGMRYFLTAIALLVPLSILALTLSWSRLPLTAFPGDRMVINAEGEKVLNDEKMALRWFCQWVFAVSQRGPGKKILYIDELRNFVSKFSLFPEVSRIARMGRAEHLELLSSTQYPRDYHADLRGAVTEWVCFNTEEPAELDAVRPYFADVDRVAALPRGSFIAYNRDSGAELAGKLF